MIDWFGTRNPFPLPMTESIENANNISLFIDSKFFAWKGNANPGFLAMYNDVHPDIMNLGDLIAAQEEGHSGQTAQTEDLELLFGDMSPMLNSFDDLTRPVAGKGTLIYNSIWGKNRDRFYHGTYYQRVAALTGLASNMTTYGVPAGATAVLAYKTLISTRRATQQLAKGGQSDNSVAINAQVEILIKKFNKSRGWLIFTLAEDVNYQAEIDAFFPLNLMRDTGVKGHYQLVVPNGDFRRICIHIFKPGEMVELIIGDTDVYICTAADATHPCSAGFLAVAGSHIIVDPTVFGDLTKKFLVATNKNLLTSTDVIFNIIQP